MNFGIPLNRTSAVYHQQKKTMKLFLENTIRLSQWLSADVKAPFPELYLAGGAVRDLMLGKAPKDVDVVCKNARTFARRLTRGKDMALVPMEKKPDVPTFRIVDRNAPDRVLDITEMRGETIQDDLYRRDFTINAIAVRIGNNGHPDDVIDPTGGQADIAAKIIRNVDGSAFESDPLRILRAFRFAAQLEFAIEPATEKNMQASIMLLTRISVERIVSELLLILERPVASETIRRMDATGVLDVIFPEILPMKGCPQNDYHHKDVWGHSLLVLENSENILNHLEMFFGDRSPLIAANLGECHRAPLLKLAALLHDVGKPSTRGLNLETGRITFYGHDETGSAMMSVITERLKLPVRDREFLSLLLSEHLHVLDMSAPNVTWRTLMRWFRRLGENVVPVIVLGMADVQGARGPASRPEAIAAYSDWSRRMIVQYDDAARRQLAQRNLISGHDLMKLGVSPVPRMGDILKHVRDAQDVGDVIDKEGALSLALRMLRDISA